MQTHVQTQSICQNEPTTQAKAIDDFSANNKILQRHASLTNNVIQCGRHGGSKWQGKSAGWHIHDEGGGHITYGSNDLRVNFQEGCCTVEAIVNRLIEYLQRNMGNTTNPVNIDTLRNKDPDGWDKCMKELPNVLKKHFR